MRRLSVLLLAVLAGVISGCSGETTTEASDGPDSSAGPATAERIDCGKTKKSAKRALRHFAEQLRSDDEGRILPLLANPKRFFAVSVGFQSGEMVVQARKRRAAARQIAGYGGLRLRINRFMNAEKPSRTTDFGFWGTWKGHRPAVGKAALDCKAGTAIVLGVAIGTQ